jgi:CheY-like chemotaxis protein
MTNQPAYILLIEDDPAVAHSLQAGLEREGFAVAWKDTGAVNGDCGIVYFQNCGKCSRYAAR